MTLQIEYPSLQQYITNEYLSYHYTPLIIYRDSLTITTYLTAESTTAAKENP